MLPCYLQENFLPFSLRNQVQGKLYMYIQTHTHTYMNILSNIMQPLNHVGIYAQEHLHSFITNNEL